MAHGRRKRITRAQFSRTKILLLLSIAWFTTIAVALRCFQKRPPLRYEGKATWLSTQSTTFLARWRNHKYRNVMIYACLTTRKLLIARQLVQHLLTCPPVFYDPRYGQIFSVPRFCLSHMCLQPFGKAHFVYAEFVLKTFNSITTQAISPAEPTTDGKVAVIVEPRKHPLLEYTIKQVMITLGHGWSLQLFLSSANEEWVRKRLHIYAGGMGEKIVVTPLRKFGLDEMEEYGNKVQSAFSAHEKLHAEIKGEHILWFQVDVVMRSHIRPEWLRYAYVGAEWPGCEYPTCSSVSCTKICGGGNSGLSLRRKSKLVQVGTRGILPENLWGHKLQSAMDLNIKIQTNEKGYFASDHLHDNSRTKWFEDDLQISYKLSKLRLLPPAEIPPKFAVDQALPYSFGIRSGDYDVHDTAPAGMHKSWLTPLIEPEIIMALLQLPYELALKLNKSGQRDT